MLDAQEAPGDGTLHPSLSWRGPRWRAREIALLLVALAAWGAIVWTQRSRYLNVWDSYLFGFALDDYDFLRGHPHPPGYPIFVFLGRMVHLVVPEANAAFTAISVVFGAAVIAMLYVLMRDLAGRSAALVTAILFAAAPNLVYNSTLALSYTAEGLGSVTVAWLAWRARHEPAQRWAVALGVAFALALGLRPSLLLYLVPITLWALWRPGVPLRRRLERIGICMLAGALTAAAWFVPMLLAGGGLHAWLATTSLQSRVVVFADTFWTHGFEAVARQSRRTFYYLRTERALLVLGMPLLLIASAIAGRGEVRVGPVSPWFRRRAGFLLVWTAPSVLFLCFVFSGFDKGPSGYALVFLPGLYALFGLVAARILDHRVDQRRTASWTALLIGLLLGATPLLAVDAAGLLRHEVRAHDDWVNDWFYLRNDYNPNSTGILASGAWPFASWYFEDYRVWGYLPDTPNPAGSPHHFVIESRQRHDDASLFGVWLGVESPVSTHPIPPGIRTLVLFDFQLAGENGAPRQLASDVKVNERVLENGWRILFVDVDDNHTTVESFFMSAAQPQPS